MKKTASKPVASSVNLVIKCMSCKSGKHLLYACPKFRALTHEKRMAVLKSSNLCIALSLDMMSRIATHYTVVEGAKSPTICCYARSLSGESHAQEEHHISYSQSEVPVTPVSSHAAGNQS